VATGLVDHPAPIDLPAVTSLPAPIARRRVYAAGWHEAPVYDAGTLGPGPTIDGPAVVQSPFTTLVLAPGDRAAMLPSGDVVVTVE
jgi:N-methylhydantoinase A/oxoprolinase/acetone carboxylase beta subunit